jgi:poly(A) polymerase
MDPVALAACRRLAPRLAGLSGERIAGEVIRLLQAPDPAAVLIVMKAEGVLEPVLPEARAFGRLRVLAWLESRALARPEIVPDPMRRLGAMLDTDRAGAEAVGDRLKLSNAQIRRMADVAAPPVVVTAAMDPAALRRALRRWGAETVRDLVLVAWADERSVAVRSDAERTARWVALLDAIDGWRPVSLPVRGQDVLDLGLGTGQRIGQVLAAVEAWWEANDYRPGREECLERLKGVAQAK